MTASDLLAVLKKNPISVACAVLSLGLGVAIYLRSDAIPEATTELDERSDEGRRYAQNINNAAQLKEQFDDLTVATKAIEAKLLRPSDIGINQQYFYRLESESGVKLTDLRQGGRGAPKGAYVPISFSVTATGDFAQAMAFLRGLEDGTHYCRLQSAAIIGGRKGPVTLNLTLELLGRP